jgi:hypothetical protein
MHFLKRYPTEVEREAMFDVLASWGRSKQWYFVEKIQALKAEKIIWPTSDGGDEDDVLELSFVGIHGWIQEPQQTSQDREYFSHKYNKAGLDYKLTLLLYINQLAWMNGPFKAGTMILQSL